MGNWMTAVELAERYVVGEERLLQYSRRGNLAFKRGPGDLLLFDESAVARFFRPRSGSIVTYRVPRGPHLGVLGTGRLGEPGAAKASSGRDGRRRALRLSSLEPILETQKKAVG